jgi:hypothetical protein
MSQAFWLTVATSALLCACGARTPLYYAETEDAGLQPESSVPDAPADTGPDSTKSDCTDPSITYVYTVTESARLYSYRPATGSFAMIGTLDCPQSAGTPFSMGVDRKGNAYVIYNGGELFKVSTATGKCQTTGFIPGDKGFFRFGMGFSTDQAGPSEKLYLAASAFDVGDIPQLGWIDLQTWKVNQVALLNDTGMELTGTGDGRLYGFFDTGYSAHLVQLDKKTGAYLDDTALQGVTAGSAWAFAFWGGDFWFFTAPSGYSTVTRFQPATHAIQEVAQLPGEAIVGAGVSTCAPEK